MAKTSFIFLLVLVASFIDLATSVNICTWGFFWCTRSTTQCISSRYRCDGSNHCSYGEDEISCPTTCSGQYSGYFRCSNNNCITRSSLCNGVNNCRDGSDESSALCGGRGFQMRLVGGMSSNEGRVEIYYSPDRTWGTICDDEWDINDANVVCRQLGLSRATQATGNARFGQGTGPILLSNVGCTGTELTLSKCSSQGWKNHNCGHHEDAGVVCGVIPSPRLTCYQCYSPTSCRNPTTQPCLTGVRNCIKTKSTTTTGGQETDVESAGCDNIQGSLCSSSLQTFCSGSKNCQRQCCSTSRCNDPRNGGSSKATKCHTCTSSSSYKDCKTRSVLRTCNSGQSMCYKADHSSGRYSKGCVSSSQCTKERLSFCRGYGASSKCKVYCCTGDGCNAGSSFGVSGVLVSTCAFLVILLL